MGERVYSPALAVLQYSSASASASSAAPASRRSVAGASRVMPSRVPPDRPARTYLAAQLINGNTSLRHHTLTPAIMLRKLFRIKLIDNSLLTFRGTNLKTLLGAINHTQHRLRYQWTGFALRPLRTISS